MPHRFYYGLGFDLKGNGLINSGDNSVFYRLPETLKCFNSWRGQREFFARGNWLDSIREPWDPL